MPQGPRRRTPNAPRTARQPLHAKPTRARRRLRREQYCDDSQRRQHQMHDEAQVEGARCVLDQHPGQQRSGTQTADVGNGRDRRRTGPPGWWGRLDHRGGRGSREDACRQARQQPAHRSSGTESASRNTIALTAAKAMPASSTGRRRADIRPPAEREKRDHAPPPYSAELAFQQAASRDCPAGMPVRQG